MQQERHKSLHRNHSACYTARRLRIRDDCEGFAIKTIGNQTRFRLWSIALLFVPALTLANGSPIARSDLSATGSIRMINQQNVDLQQETLQVTIDGDWATVRAEYRLLNRGPAATVAYGFPVDYENPDWCNDCDDVSAEEKEAAGKHLRDVRIEANGKPLSTREVAEQKPPVDKPPPEFLRTWILTELAFSAGEIGIVTVSYRVRNRLDDWWYSTNFSPRYSQRKFRYQLSPSGNWGDGKVDRLDITVDLAKLTKLGGKVVKVAPAGHTLQDNQLHWRFTDIDLSRAADLEIEYDDSARLLSSFIAERRLPNARIARATASSTLDQPAGSGRHDIAKLLDGDLDTAWCEGATGDGAGQTLTFNFEPDTVVSAIGIVNGYTKNPDVYLGNGRVRHVSVAATLPVTEQPSASLPDHDLKQLIRGAPASFLDWVANFGYTSSVTDEVTLTIDAATPGRKHSDTCISEIFFVGHSAR